MECFSISFLLGALPLAKFHPPFLPLSALPIPISSEKAARAARRPSRMGIEIEGFFAPCQKIYIIARGTILRGILQSQGSSESSKSRVAAIFEELACSKIADNK